MLLKRLWKHRQSGCDLRGDVRQDWTPSRCARTPVFWAEAILSSERLPTFAVPALPFPAGVRRMSDHPKEAI